MLARKQLTDAEISRRRRRSHRGRSFLQGKKGRRPRNDKSREVDDTNLRKYSKCVYVCIHVRIRVYRS